MKSRPMLTIIIAAVLAAMVWLLSTYFTGHPEPWDGSLSYYLGGLFLAGFISALASPLPAWGHYVGVVVGQIAYMILSGAGEFIALGAIFSAFYSLVAFFGVALAFAVRFAVTPRGQMA